MIIEIDFDSNEALYMQLRNQIVLGIATSLLSEGEPLPSVRRLSEDIGINMHTVNKAYAVLREEGFVRMDHRRGVVVAVDSNHAKALEELQRNLSVELAIAACKGIKKAEVHELIDKIYGDYVG
ncbi:MAG: GntR family transcriptional regulator [Lachnospiraceae bacterium]|nr:GntR family transcriptional regulator [Lachnospiraceae bacterium]